MLRIFGTGIADPEEERRDPGPVQFFLKTKIPHTHLITRKKTAWNVNLMIYLLGKCVTITCWTILPPLLSNKDHDQSSVIFGSEKDQ